MSGEGRNYTTEGIILKRKNYGEADKILTVLTKYRGKITVLAKGIRKINSRKAPHLELFSQVRLTLNMGKSWDYVTEAQTIEVFPFLRNHLENIAWSYKIVEQIDRLCAEKVEYTVIFELLLSTFRKINNQKTINIQKIVEDFSVQLVWELGYLPKGNLISGDALTHFLEAVMERNMKSDNLLNKLSII